MAYTASRLGRRAAAIAAAAFAAATAMGAEEASGFALSEQTITASRVQAPESETSPAVSVISAADIAARGAVTVADALEVVAGLSLNDKGPEGSQVSVSIRGSTTNQVVVLVDGVRVNDALSGLADLSRIPAESIERIEVRRGGGSSLYGGDAVGGVVNIITKKKEAPLCLRLELGGYLPAPSVTGFGFNKVQGAYDAVALLDSQRLALSWAPRFGEALLTLSAGATRAANAYSFIDANYERRERENSGLLAAEASLGLDLPLFEGRLSAKAGAGYGNKGVPGSESSPSLRASETDFDGRVLVRWSAERFFSDFVSVDASLRGDYTLVDYRDGDRPEDDARHDVATLGLESVHEAFLRDGHSLVFGLSSSYARAASDTVGSPSRLSAGAFAELALVFGKLTLRPSARYDFSSDIAANDPLGGLAAALGAAYRIAEGDTLKGNLSRAYRVPTFNDLYWPSIAGAQGNPDLLPETAYEANFGYERRRAGLSYDAAAYVRYAQDVILWQEGGDGTWRPSNYGAALYPGIEQELTADLSEGFRLSVNYNYLRSYALSGSLGFDDDKRIPMTPSHSLKAVLSGKSGKLSWSSTLTFASLRYLKTANLGYLPAYFTADVLARFELSKGASIYAAADNLFDEQYEILEGYPMPGTKIRIGCELKFLPQGGAE